MVRRTSSGHLGRYLAVSVCIHLVSISWAFHLLHAPSDPFPRPEPVRVTLVAPDLPAGPSPAITSRAVTSPQTIDHAAVAPLVPPPTSPSTLASMAMPEVGALPRPTVMQPPKATVHAPLPQLAPPATVPELEPIPRARATSRPTPAFMASPTLPASAPAVTNSATPAPPTPTDSPAPIRPRQNTPQPLVPMVSAIGKIPELSPVTRSRSTPPPVAHIPSTELPVTPPAVSTVASVSPAAAPPRPQTSLHAPSTPTTQRTSPPVTPVSVPAPTVEALPQVSSTPRANRPPRSAPIAPVEVPQRPMEPHRVPQRQAIINQSSQELPSPPHMAKMPSTPSFSPANPGQQAALLERGAAPAISPRFAAKPCPDYPYIARRRKSEGVVVVAFDVSADGHINNVRVVQSSGDTILDKEAENTIKRWRPVPEAFANAPVTRLTVPFRFELADLHNPKRLAPPPALDGERVICDGTSQHG